MSGVSIHHYGDGGQHKGERESCSYPDCAWPRNGDLVTTVFEGVEYTGEFDDFGDRPVVRTGSGRTYVISDAKKPDWGAHCPHGLQIIEKELAAHLCQDPINPVASVDCRACWPVGRKVTPWPCGEAECTEEAYDRGRQEEEDQYYEDLWSEYYNSR